MPRKRFDGSTPGPGRPKGLPNKATVEVKQLCVRLVNDPAYLTNVKSRLDSGNLAPAMEAMLWHYAYGKPKETVKVETDAPVRFTIDIGSARAE